MDEQAGATGPSPADDLARAAYEARFAHERFANPDRGLFGSVLPWSHLPEDAWAVWRRVALGVMGRSRSRGDLGDPFKREAGA